MFGGRTVAGRVTAFSWNSLSRRNFLRLGGVGLAGVALLGASACAGAADPNEVVLSHPEGFPMVGLIKKFNERHKDGFRVTVRVMPNDYGEYFEKLQTEFQVGGGGIDVILGDIIWVAEFAANDWISDLSGRFPEDERSAFVDGTIRSFTYGGQIYGVPRVLDAGMLYYRKDLLEESGYSEPPKTWEELKEMAGKVVKDQGTRYGYVFQGADYEGGVCNGLEFIWTHGGEVLDPNDASKVIIGSPESVAALATEQSMVSDGVAPQGVASYREYESEITFMLHGDAVFCRNWPYMYSTGQRSEVKGKDRARGRLAATRRRRTTPDRQLPRRRCLADRRLLGDEGRGVGVRTVLRQRSEPEDSGAGGKSSADPQGSLPRSGGDGGAADDR